MTTRTAVAAAVLLVAGALACGPSGPPPAPIDVLITNARVIDGTGSPARDGAVAITGGQIVEVLDGEAATAAAGRAARVIDAAGRVVAPGFIDTHSHSDMPLVTDGNAQSRIRQGVTTEVIGESGSIAPQPAATADQPWTDFAGYFAVLEKRGIAVNLLSYVGLGTVRELVIGDGNRRPTADELQKMQGIVTAAMQQGVEGVSDRAHLSPQRLRRPRRAGRAVDAGRGDGGPLRLAPASRRQAAARRHRGGNRDRRARQDPRACLPHQGHRSAELRPHEGSRRAGRGGAGPRREGHRGRLPLRRQRYQPHRHPAAVGDGRRHRHAGRAAERPGDAARIKRDMEDPNATWDNRYQSAGTWANVQLASIGRRRGLPTTPRTPTPSTRACASPTPPRSPPRTRSSSSSTCCVIPAAA